MADEITGFRYSLSEDIVVLGKRGHGKSTWIHNAYYTAPRAVCYNVMREEGFVVLSDAYCKTPEAVVRALQQGYRRVCYIPSAATVLDKDLVREDYDRVLEPCYEMGHMVYLCDDLGYITARHEGGPPIVTNMMNKVALWGRHQDLTHLYAAQRNQSLPNTMVTQVEHRVVYHLDSEDVKAYKAFLGQEFVEAQKTMQPYSYCWFHATGMEVMPPVPILYHEKSHRLYVEKPMPIEVV